MKLILPLLTLCLAAAPAFAQTTPKNADVLTSVKQSIAQQTYPCWKPPVEAVGADSVPVTLNLTMKKDGYIGEMSLDKKDAPKYHTDTGYRASANAAMAALIECQPIKNLPLASYDAWKTLSFTFDARDVPASATSGQVLLNAPDANAIAGTGLLTNSTGTQAPATDSNPSGVIPADQIH